mgnify:CR=1 FL=1
MKINKTKNGSSLTVAVEGRIDTVTAPEFESDVKGAIDGIDALILDFEKVSYLSSAGLRVLLSLHKIMNKRGTMTVKNANETVKDIFEVTGFSEILTIE